MVKPQKLVVGIGGVSMRRKIIMKKIAQMTTNPKMRIVTTTRHTETIAFLPFARGD